MRAVDRSRLDLAVADDPAVLAELAPEWHALWQRASGRFAESPRAGRLAWQHVAEPAGDRLAVAVGRQAGELVLVLPMAVHRRGPVRLLRPLGPGGADYTAALVAPGAPRDDRSSASSGPMLAQAWRLLVRRCRADVAHLPALAAGSDLHAVATRQPGARLTGTDVLAVAALSDGQTFEQYCAGLGRLSHRRPGDFRRRLARAGDLQIAVLEPGDPVIAGLVDWMLEHKRNWARRAGKDGPWLAAPGFRDFVVAALSPAGGTAIARILVVRLDGEPVAASVMGLGASRVEGLVNGFDPAFARFSPGAIGVEACIEWAFGQGLGVDFGIGAEDYKRYWSRGGFAEVHNLELPLDLRGRLALRARSAISSGKSPPRLHDGCAGVVRRFRRAR